MIKTRPIEFVSVEQRNDVHDAVKGRAQALSKDGEQLRVLFDLGQTFAYVQTNEPPNNSLLSIRFAFTSQNEYKQAVRVLTGMTDKDLEWLGQELDRVGIDESYDGNEEEVPGGLSEIFGSD